MVFIVSDGVILIPAIMSGYTIYLSKRKIVYLVCIYNLISRRNDSTISLRLIWLITEKCFLMIGQSILK